ncbi:hypothetical protein NW767_014599 [Fusarium falciforme]|nr:hypothetical protein NW767_014599 [Fusarium falciforme]
MSGTPFLKESMLESATESTYTRVIEALGGGSLSADDQLKLLLETPAENFWTKLPRDVPLFPAMDYDTIHVDPTFETLREGSVSAITAAVPGRQWCEAILIGDCQFDAHVLGLALKMRKPDTIASSFVQAVTETLSPYPGAAEEVLQAYRINALLADADVVRPILTFASDIGFYAPAVSYARAWSPNAYLYHLNEPNPWDGPNKGDCTHMFDVTLLFQNFNEKLPDQQRETGRQMAEHFIKFINGDAPFDRYEKQNPGAMVYGGPHQGAAFVRSDDAQDFGRRRMLSELASKVPLDDLIIALRKFIG